MFLMRLPRTPTQAPTASTLVSIDADGDLGAVAGLAGQGLDLDDPLGDLGHFELEQPPDEVRVRAARGRS